jgi:plasmid stabilization system protein ParE
MSQYILSPAALEDLDSIWQFIAEDNLDAAERVVAELESACSRLAVNPNMGHVREDLADSSFRFWPVRSYLVVYRPATKPLQVVRFWHGARGVPNLL